MSFIKTVKQLTEILENADSNDHASIMKRISIEAPELESFATWSEKCYTRNCLARTAQYEIILLCWEIGAKTPVHGHGGEDCWVYQVKGTVQETRFQQVDGNLVGENRMILSPGRLTYMNDQMGYHNIENISKERAMTLHIYASPIDSCKVYNDLTDCFENKEMSYHTYKGNELAISVS